MVGRFFSAVLHLVLNFTQLHSAGGCPHNAPLSVDHKRGLIGFMRLPVEIELVDGTRRDRLVVLAEIEQEAIGSRRKDMTYGVGVLCCHIAKIIGYLFGEGCGVLAARDVLLARSIRQSERDELPYPRQLLRYIRAGLCCRHLRDINRDRYVARSTQHFLDDVKASAP